MKQFIRFIIAFIFPSFAFAQYDIKLGYQQLFREDSVIIVVKMYNLPTSSSAFTPGFSTLAINVPDTANIEFTKATIIYRGIFDAAQNPTDFDPMTLTSSVFGVPTIPFRLILGIKQKTFPPTVPLTLIPIDDSVTVAEISIPTRNCNNLSTSWRNSGSGRTSVLAYDGTDISSTVVFANPTNNPLQFSPTIIGPNAAQGGDAPQVYQTSDFSDWEVISGFNSAIIPPATNINFVQVYFECGFNASRVDTVKVTEGSCSTKLAVTVAAPLATAAISPVSSTICEGDSVTLTANFTNAAAILWSTGETTNTISVKRGGQIVLAAVDNFGCPTLSSAHQVTVNQQPSNSPFRVGSASLHANGNQTVNDIAYDEHRNRYVCGTIFGIMDMDPGPGTASLNGGISGDAFVAKYDSAGNYVWAFKIGAAGSDLANALVFYQGLVYVGGQFGGTVDFDPNVGIANLVSKGTADGFVAIYSDQAIYQGAFSIGSNANNEKVNDIKVDLVGDFYVTGTYSGNVNLDFEPGLAVVNPLTFGGGVDSYIAKYDLSGSGKFLQWVRGISGVGEQIVEEIKLSFNSAGIFVFATGSHVNDNVDYNSGGTPFLKNDVGFTDIFLARYDGIFGDAQWVHVIGSNFGNDKAFDLDLDHFNNVWIVGQMSNTVDFDPAAPNFSLVSTAQTDAFVAGYQFNGTFINAGIMGGAGNDVATCIYFDHANYLWLAGTFASPVIDIAPGAATFGLTNNSDVGKTDVFLAYLRATATPLALDLINAQSFGNEDDEVAASITGLDNQYISFAGNYKSDSISVAGLTSATVYYNGDHTFDPVIGEFDPSSIVIVPPIDTLICPGDPYALVAQGLNLPVFEFDWQRNDISTGVNISSFSVTDSGTYHVFVENNVTNCKNTSIEVKVGYKPSPIAALPADTTLCGIDSLDAGLISGITAVTWTHLTSATPYGTSKKVMVDQAGDYELLLTLNGCSDRDTISISDSKKFNVKVMLEGKYSSLLGAMADTTLEFHTELSKFLSNSAAPIPTGRNVPTFKSVAAELPNNVVDVVAVVIRGSAPSYSKLDTVYAWLLTDGTLRDYHSARFAFAHSCEALPSVPTHLQIEHRNHLPAMSNGTLNLPTGPYSAANSIDFTAIGNIYQGGAVNLGGAMYGLYAGDITGNDNEVNANDLYKVSSDELLLLSGYQPSDVNCDGFVNGLDRNAVSKSNDLLPFSTVP